MHEHALPVEGFRWVTVSHAAHPELELTLMLPGPPLNAEAAAFVRGQLEKGELGGLGLRVDDCRKMYAELTAKGVTFLQEPAARPYGVEAVMRDVSGNWLVLIEPTEFNPEDLAKSDMLDGTIPAVQANRSQSGQKLA